MSHTNRLEKTSGNTKEREELLPEAPLNVGQVLPSLDRTLDTIHEAFKVAPPKLQEFGRQLQAKMAQGTEDLADWSERFFAEKKFAPRELSLTYKLLSLTLAGGLILAACMPAFAVTPDDRPARPTVPVTQTVEALPTATAEQPVTPTAEPSPTVEPTPEKPDYNWTAAEAVTVELDATEEEILAALEKFGVERFPATPNPSSGEYNFNCLVESISYLKEGHYVTVGDFDIRATAQCSYLDTNGKKQIITVALVIENRVELTTWTPKFETEEGSFAPSFIQEFFERSEDIKPGSVISITFGLPNEVNQNIETSTEGAVHHGRAMSQLHSEEQIAAYTATGNPEMLGKPIILPFYAQIDSLYQFLSED